MAFEGKIGASVARFVQKTCRKQKPDQVEDCVEAVSQRLVNEVSRFCAMAAPREHVLKARCEQQLLKSIWSNPTELKRRLKGKLKKIADLLKGPEPFTASNQTHHRGLKSLVIQEAQLFQRQPPNHGLPLGQILWEQPLGLVDDTLTGGKFKLRLLAEWQKVETDVFLTKNGNRFHKTITWSCWLEQNPDGSHILYWRKESNPDQPKPTRDDPAVIFSLVDGYLPANLSFGVEGQWSNDTPEVTGFHLRLKK